MQRNRSHSECVDCELGGGDLYVCVEEIQAIKMHLLIGRRRARVCRSPHRTGIRRGFAGRGGRRGRDCQGKASEIEIRLDQRLAGEIDRSPAVESVLADRAGEPVDREHRAFDPDIGRSRERLRQQVRRLKRKFDRNTLPDQAIRQRRAFQREPHRPIVPTGTGIECRFAAGELCNELDMLDAAFDAVGLTGEFNCSIGHDHPINLDADGRRSVAPANPSRRRCRDGHARALAQERDAQHRMRDGNSTDLRMTG